MRLFCATALRSGAGVFDRRLNCSSLVSHSCTFKMSAGETCKPIVVSGPSGGGKSTILTRLFKEHPGCFAFSISHTTRQPRAGEADGKDYYFITKPQIHGMISNGHFLEYAEFGGNIYGTSKQAVKEIQSTGRICILDLEIQGVRSIRKTDLNPRYVYIKPPSLAVLEQRLRNRGTETEESLAKRLERARVDMQAIEQEPHLFDHVVINDDFEKAYKDFVAIVEKDILAYCERQRSSGDTKL